jgi:hypothetical protein
MDIETLDKIFKPQRIALIETIYSRFGYFFFWQSHEVASRYCYTTMTGRWPSWLNSRKETSAAFWASAVWPLTLAERQRSMQFWFRTTGGTKARVDCLYYYCNPRMIVVFKRRDFEIRQDPNPTLVEIQKQL